MTQLDFSGSFAVGGPFAKTLQIHCMWLVIGMFLMSCAEERETMLLVGTTMGTEYTVTIVVPNQHNDDESLNLKIQALLARINASMSTYDPNSELSRVNQNKSADWIDISAELYSVLEAALSVSGASAGAFDVTVGGLVNLWGFGPERGSGVIPDSRLLEAARRDVGAANLQLQADPPALRKRRADVYIDLSGIVKGYAVDQVAEFLIEKGFADFLVDIGGEMRAAGTNRNGVAWKIGIEDPRDAGRQIVRTVALANTGLASSGNYRNFFEINGTHYGHTIDPKTGAPTQHELAAVSVVHPSAMLADAWATAFMSMGYSAGMSVAAQRDLAVLFIVDDGTTATIAKSAAFDVATKP
ncbi:MAG: FAD:protein FMN transferase [Proteobacteria bacterium]|nr:FAD:protein FMN transferase [Pseudomonadota bacterium]